MTITPEPKGGHARPAAASAVDAEAFRRLLRWYPRGWRTDHGEVFVSTLLDDAQARGIARPDGALRRSAMLHGTASRLTPRAAFVAVMGALVCAAVFGVSLVVLLPTELLASQIIAVAARAVAPMLIAFAVTALLRARGLVSDARALAILAAGLIGLTLGAAAQWSWSVGFDLADAGRSPTWFASLWAPLVVAGSLVGALALGAVIDALLARTGIHRIGRGLLVALGAIVLTPIVGVGVVLTPYGTALIAVAVAIAAAKMTAMPVRRDGGDRRTPSSTRRVRTPSLAVLACLAVASVVGTTGLAVALSGSSWLPGQFDGTQAMALGIQMLLLSAVPLVVACGASAAPRSPDGPLGSWLRWALVAAAALAVAVAYVWSPDWNRMAPGLMMGSVLGGAALAWWLAVRLPLARGYAVTIGVMAGVVAAACGGMMLAPLLAFAVPVVALVVLVVELRRPRVSAPAT